MPASRRNPQSFVPNDRRGAHIVSQRPGGLWHIDLSERSIDEEDDLFIGFAADGFLNCLQR
jgi:hypothetical protein